MESDGGATRKLVGGSMELKGEMIVLSFSRAGMFRLFLLSFSRAGMSFYQPLAIQDLNVFLFQINTYQFYYWQISDFAGERTFFFRRCRGAAVGP